MNVWLINPPVIRRKVRAGALVRNLFYNSPPLGLAYIGAVLEQAGRRVTITDCPVEQFTPDDLHRLASEISPDLVGIGSTTSYFHMAVESANAVRRALPKVPICIGGPHFNGNPELLLEHEVFDFGVRGEGEFTLREVAERIESGTDYLDVPGVVSRKPENRKTEEPKNRPLIEDLDVLPFPARRLLPLDKYSPMPNDIYRLPKTAMISSRGCPFRCIFCDKQTFGHTYRSLSPKRTVEEMHMLVRDHGIRDIAFVDSIFTPNKKRISEVLDAMEADPPKASWTCSCRANVLDEELLRRMRALGCWRIRIAVESGNEEILRTIQKGITKQEMREMAETAYRLGFQIKTFFMIGHIGETRETIEESIRFALSLPLKDITVQINTPLKGTPQYELCKQRGKLLSSDTSRYTFFQPIFVPDGLTAEELQNAQNRFYRRFYMNPGVIWRHFKTIRRPRDLLKYFHALPLVSGLFFRPRRIQSEA